ncbi:unnamed protein product [Prorocentrum cordatum]|uniref:Uncharacterized protein n=1 Tax=Prorocentrum cordatum TaxID=2364126 RepID=A0ABN9RCZ6_9DINO|nr:unnamed protein product [Polarella glacialis]
MKNHTVGGLGPRLRDGALAKPLPRRVGPLRSPALRPGPGRSRPVGLRILTAGAADPVREEEEDFCSSSLSRSRLRDADAKKVVHVCCRGAAARRGRGRSGWMPFRSPSAACQPAARGPRAARGRRVGPLMAMPRWFAGEATCAFCMEWCCPEFSRFPTSARSVEEDAEACGRSTSTAPRRARIPGGRGAAVFAPAAPASRGRRARVSMEGAGPWSLPFGRLEFDICTPPTLVSFFFLILLVPIPCL